MLLVTRSFPFGSTGDIDLATQYANVIAAAGGWNWISAVVSPAAGSLDLAKLFESMVTVAFRYPDFVRIMGGPPSRQWCTWLVPLRNTRTVDDGDALTSGDLTPIGDNIVRWTDADGAVDIAAKVEMLPATPDQLLLVKANVRLLLSAIETLDSTVTGKGTGQDLRVLLCWLMTGFKAGCQAFREAPPLLHRASPCKWRLLKMHVLW
ncbi:hypothetical protein BC828DRAFT_401504 [Blastocladiella britannica]|nr:hypothetical protein BC828DRAFT_401504 [Blastocladiella britannica]